MRQEASSAEKAAQQRRRDQRDDSWVPSAVAVNGARDGLILIADDSAAVRTAVGTALRSVGYTVVEAATGAEAIGLVGHRTYDVAIADLRMAEQGGLELLAAVKRKSPRTEVIILTGTDPRDVDDRLRALRLGAYDLLLKPPRCSHPIISTVGRAFEETRLPRASLPGSTRVLSELGVDR